MARIPQAELERLKQDISVARLAQTRGVELKAHGANLIGLCPFHDDHDPSLVITPANNLWHCLGACQAGGSVVDFERLGSDLDFPLSDRHDCNVGRAEIPQRLDATLRAGGDQAPVRHLSRKMENRDLPPMLCFLESQPVCYVSGTDDEARTLRSVLPVRPEDARNGGMRAPTPAAPGKRLDGHFGDRPTL